MIRSTRVRRLRMHRATQGLTLVIGVALIAGATYFAFTKHITLVVDGRPQAIRTTSGSVQELLVSEDVSLDSGVLVEPAPTARLADGMTVVVSPAPGLPDGAIRTPEGTVYRSLTDVGVWAVVGTGSSASARELAESSVSASSAGSSPVVSVRAVVSGKVHDVSTNAATTGALLSAMGIEPDADDRVRPSPSTPLHPGLRMVYREVEVVTKVKAVSIPFTIETYYSPELVPGTSRVTQQGRVGAARETFRVTIVDGEVIDRVPMGSWVEQPPQPEERLSGPASSTAGTIVSPTGTGRTQSGLATWYDPPWSGLSAAHPTLPFGTYVTVTDLASGRSVVVVINDRGPFGPGRIIDLSPEAFAALRPLGAGVLNVGLSW